ncbi:hypothetical protein A1OQ_05685 [Enterovibrio norvegicus FF-162]|uniref:hypothetical protein n=1 Tax=Enterovibrio norvegicus TaxID=188144 RepID=UPI0002DE1373|nr:hypothetical protein [Enterovibrio norvegicus]OEE77132.1 hypothetical protein A1OQ_05685 [Enterovibrio norvegicus FF-162]
MEYLTTLLANPIVAAIGYVLSFVAAVIAILQALGKKNAQKLVQELKVEILTVKEENTNLKFSINRNENKNNVNQGDKSQYFQDNSGQVNIDNRG